MAKRRQQQKGVRDPKDLKQIRKQIDRRPRATKKAPADVPPKHASSFGRTEHGKVVWTADRDEQLRVNYTGHRGNIASLAKAFGLPFHVIKERVKFLKLTGQPLTSAPRARSRKTRTATTPDTIEQTAATPPAETSAEAMTARLRHARCPHCYTRATWDPQDSPEQLLAQGFVRGFDPDPIEGFPVCPNCRTTMVSAEPVEAPAAIRQAIAAKESHQPRLWPDPPFNFEGAWREVCAKEDEIQRLQTEYDTLAKAQRRAAKDLAKANRERTLMIADLRKRQLEKEREGRRRADAQEPPPAPPIGCIFESNTGKPGPICRSESPSLVVAALGLAGSVLSDITSEAHRLAEVKANSITVDIAEKILDPQLVSDALLLSGLHGIPADVVETWDEAQRREALAWVDNGFDQTQLPDVLGMPHIAGEPSTDRQSCLECGVELVRMSEGGSSWPAGALVGMHCTGVETATEKPAAPADAAHA